ncbi:MULTISPECIES: ABC-three component system middle component 2 [Bacillus]|uniref:ABC-three component system middle component 2 n=1 Tax=Bacillus TaxID=1386 RepID=UPI001625D395|nr:ABC-three component system middle component 2 [Bacillus subtilis]MCY9374953.1 hypothetical protein [Bacillus sp. T17B1]MDP0485220.1 hypothetical protein [Bacillus subtilis]MED1938406.1 hypothetical protein [Bacillus subtilis]
MDTNKNDKDNIAFNTPFEIGLRSLVIISAIEPKGIDVQRLLIYDYFIIHSGDVEKGPPSIHPNLPYRSSQLLIRRKVLQKGLNLMYSKSLLDIVYDNSGISFRASKLTKPFLALFNSTYLEKLKENAQWVIEKFSSYSDDDLRDYVESNLIEWGGEFKYEFLFGSEEE